VDHYLDSCSAKYLLKIGLQLMPKVQSVQSDAGRIRAAELELVKADNLSRLKLAIVFPE
jgi:hypothetical protein